ncbi:MAG: hypothetical protein ACRDJY_12655 [Thermoleophilaceae bacterium]
MLVGALAVHELRYVLAGTHQDEHAHAYMAWLVPLTCALLGLALAEFSVRLARRIRRDARPVYVPAGVRWLTASSLLTTIFALQEVVERLLAHGRVDVTEALVVHGGWVALPLCFVVGAVIALLLRGARALLTRRWGTTPAAPARIVEPLPRLPRARALRVPVIACNLAGRAPPRVVI